MQPDQEQQPQIGEIADDLEHNQPEEALAGRSLAHVDQHEKRLLIQQQLVLLLHAWKCSRKEEENKNLDIVQEQCLLPHCQTMKGVISHMTLCQAGRNCPTAHCASSRRIMFHFGTCTRLYCSICGPFRRDGIRVNPIAIGQQQNAVARIPGNCICAEPGGVHHSAPRPCQNLKSVQLHDCKDMATTGGGVLAAVSFSAAVADPTAAVLRAGGGRGVERPFAEEVSSCTGGAGDLLCNQYPIKRTVGHGSGHLAPLVGDGLCVGRRVRFVSQHRSRDTLQQMARVSLLRRPVGGGLRAMDSSSHSIGRGYRQAMPQTQQRPGQIQFNLLRNAMPVLPNLPNLKNSPCVCSLPHYRTEGLSCRNGSPS